MHPTTIDLMRDQVRAIYRALTGSDLPETEEPSREEEVPMEEVARRFADLEAMARRIPSVIDRVPPFSFAPPLDAIDEHEEVVIEVAVPGVEAEDVTVECTGEMVAISGVRRGPRSSDGREYLHAEIPRGPFYRVVRLPYPISAEAKVELDRGLIVVRLTKSMNGQA